MFDIEMQVASPEFGKCWHAAGFHIQSQVQDGIRSWLRVDLMPPFLEHLSFRLGNQLFFVRIEDVDGNLKVPGTIRGLLSIADGCKGHACIMPMTKKFLNGDWAPTQAGWGLIDARTKAPIDPISLVTDAKIEMTPWELHDFAVRIVRDQLKKEGYKPTSWQGNPGVDPAIWFVGDSKGPEWVVVRAVRYPEKNAKRPHNWTAIAEGCAKLSKIGHFASVAFASADQQFDTATENIVPLWRGYGAEVSYEGLTD